MLEYALIAVVIAVVLFEIIEHVVLPLIGYAVSRKRRPISGAEGMIGKIAEVRLWHADDGQVFVEGELWRAICASPLVKGDKVTILAVDDLTLCVRPFDETSPGSDQNRDPKANQQEDSRPVH